MTPVRTNTVTVQQALAMWNDAFIVRHCEHFADRLQTVGSTTESRIRDADIAQEAANLTKAQVLQQASMAAMAQANSAPQAVLSLLRG